MPYQTVWVEPEVLHRGEHVTVLVAYDEHERDDPLFYWVRPIPAGYDLSAEGEFKSIDIRDLGFRGKYGDEVERLRFIELALAQGLLKPVRLDSKD